jgi:hypothetical protein
VPCANLQATLNFYTQVLPYKHLSHLDHRTPSGDIFAVIVSQPSTQNAERADQQRGWDLLVFAGESRAGLGDWAKKLDEAGVKRSKIFHGI